MMRATLSVTLLAFCYFGVLHSAPSPLPTKELDLLMPGVKPQSPDTYLCQAFKIDEAHAYITAFKPKADASIAHHILLYGCEVPGAATGKVWNCGEMSAVESRQFQLGPVCRQGPRIHYAWAMDAPQLRLPADVSFDVGQDTGTKYLVLQVHYKNVTKFLPPQNGKDNSGLTLETTATPTQKQAGVFLIGTGGEIPAHSVEYFEAVCPYEEDIEFVPFAYRTHAHSLGRVISGYRIRDGEWTEIGRKDPRLPEMFYNVTSSDLTVKKGDILAARCTMENGLDHTVSIGQTQADEMCNFYVMYYVATPPTVSRGTCFSPGPPTRYWADDSRLDVNNIPSTASVIPGSDKPLIRNVTRRNTHEEQDSWMKQVRDVDPEQLAYLVRRLDGDDQTEDGEGAWPVYPNNRQQLQEAEPYDYYPTVF